MRKTWLFVALLAVAVAVQAKDGGRKFVVSMTGAQEAPGPGDPDGSGIAILRLNPGTEQVCFSLFVEDITLPATAAHIHLAPPGEPGPVVVGLAAPDATGFASGCVEAPREGILAIIQNPAAYYVNVHTTDFGPGAVRGQLAR